MFFLCRIIGLGLLLTLGSQACAAEPEIRLVLKDHRFNPTEVTAPAGQKVRLVIENQDATPEEFESYALNREKIVPAGHSVQQHPETNEEIKRILQLHLRETGTGNARARSVRCRPVAARTPTRWSRGRKATARSSFTSVR